MRFSAHRRNETTASANADFEMLFICIPSVALGILFGAAAHGCCFARRCSKTAAEILVDIPFKQVGLAVLCWLFGIILMRLIVFQTALHQPLTGRLSYCTEKSGAVLRRQSVC